MLSGTHARMTLKLSYVTTATFSAWRYGMMGRVSPPKFLRMVGVLGTGGCQGFMNALAE